MKVNSRRTFLKQGFAAGSALLLANFPAKPPSTELDQIFEELDKKLHVKTLEINKKHNQFAKLQYLQGDTIHSLNNSSGIYPYYNVYGLCGPSVYVDYWISNEDEQYILQKFARKYNVKSFSSNRQYKVFTKPVDKEELCEYVTTHKKNGASKHVALCNIQGRKVLQEVSILKRAFTDWAHHDHLDRAIESINSNKIYVDINGYS